MSRVLDPLQTEAELCDELLPVLERIREHGSDLAGADYDMKAIRLDVLLTKDLDAVQIESLRLEFSRARDIDFGDCWVACKVHWQSIGLRTVSGKP